MAFLGMRALDRADGADDLLIFERWTTVHPTPGEHKLQGNVGVDTMPKEMSGE